MSNSSSQSEFSLQVAGKSVQGMVVMTLDANGVPQAAGDLNPVPMIDAYAAPVNVTWNNSTTLNTTLAFNTAGMDTIALTISPSGTITAGAITFEVFDGTAWIPVKSARLSSYNTDSTFSLVGSTLQGWTVPVAGYPQFRVRLSTAITGSSTPQALISVIVSSAPDVSIVTVGLDPLQSNHPGVLTMQAEQVVAVGAASAQSAAVGANTNRVVLVSTTACWVAFGSNPTAVAAATGNVYVPANIPMPPISVTSGTTKIAVIQASAGGSLSIIESL